jgi:hypothetical protein
VRRGCVCVICAWRNLLSRYPRVVAPPPPLRAFFSRMKRKRTRDSIGLRRDRGVNAQNLEIYAFSRKRVRMTVKQLQLVQRFLSFYVHDGHISTPSARYRGYETGLETKVKIESSDGHYLFWLNDYQVQEGMRAAVNESNESKRKDKPRAYTTRFMNQMTWTEETDPEKRPYKVLKRHLNTIIKALSTSTDRKFLWCINVSPVNTLKRPLNTASSEGSHWMVIVLEFPESLDILDAEHKIYVRKFDPLGRPLNGKIKHFLKRCMIPNLISLLLKKNYLNVEIDDTQLDEENQAVQLDDYQCGIWCVWFAHVFSGASEYEEIFDHIPDKNKVDKEFREMYYDITLNFQPPGLNTFNESGSLASAGTKTDPLVLEV